MNFALIGDDPDVLPLVRAIASHPCHQLTHVANVASTLPDVLKLAPSVSVKSSWEELLLAESLQAVIVSGDGQDVLQAAKQLAAAGKPLLLFCRTSQGIAFVYELTLIRDDSNVALVPAFPLSGHPQVKTLRKLIDSGELGNVLHLKLEREIQTASDAIASKGLSIQAIDDALLGDIDLIRMLVGEYRQVTAFRSTGATHGVSLATITLAGDGLPDTSWTAKATSSSSDWKLTVSGEIESCTLALLGEPPILNLQNGEIEALAGAASATFDSGEELLQRFELAIAGEAVHPDWTDVTHDFEIVEATHRSVARRRTIDLHFETTSERAVFKSQMTAIGCGLLALTLASLLGLLIVGAVLDNRDALEANAASADFIICHKDFAADSAKLTSVAKRQVAKIATRMKTVSSSVLVEQSENSSNPALDEARREAVVALLNKSGAVDADRRTILTPVHGQVVGLVMKILRFAWSIPLILFLLLQLLIFVTKPSTGHQRACPTGPCD